MATKMMTADIRIGLRNGIQPLSWMCMFVALVAISMFSTVARADCKSDCMTKMATNVGSDAEAVKAADEECTRSCAAGGVATTPTSVPAPEEFDVTSCPTPKKGKSIDVDKSEEKSKCLLKDFESSDCTPKKGKSVDVDESETKGRCVFKAFETSDCTPKKGKTLDEEKSETKGRCVYAVAPPVEDKPKTDDSKRTMPWVWIVIGFLILALAIVLGGFVLKSSSLSTYQRREEEENRLEAQRRRDGEARRQYEADEVRHRVEEETERRDRERRERNRANWQPPPDPDPVAARVPRGATDDDPPAGT